MIRGYVFGQRETIAKLDRLTKQGKATLRVSIQRLTLKLLAKVKEQKLTGQVLKVRTGKLRRSINQRVTVDTKGIYGIVGTNVEYGRMHELGGTYSVKAHARMMKMAWGKKLRTPKVVQVREHKITYPKRSFLASALKDMEPNVRAEIRRALIASMK